MLFVMLPPLFCVNECDEIRGNNQNAEPRDEYKAHLEHV